MFRNKRIRKVSVELDRDFYRKCFLSSDWSLKFDLNFLDPSLDKEQYINQKICVDYPELTRLIIYDVETLNRVAFAHILIDDYNAKRCTLTGGVNPDLMGKGYGSYGLYVFLKLIFSEMKMNKVSCQVYDFNNPSFRMLESAGFSLEGVLRQHAFNYLSQQFVDLKIYSLLHCEFKESRLYKSFTKISSKEVNLLCQKT